MTTLKFTDWDKAYYSIDESLGENIHNWLSKNFGGKVSEIDGILSDIVRAEKEYSKEWEKLELENDSMKSQIESGSLEEKEEKELRKKIKNNTELISISLRKKNQKVRVLDSKGDKIVQGNPRLSKYWELKKAESDLEIIENLYKISKNLSDKGIQDDLYGKYKRSYSSLQGKKEKAEKVEKEIDTEEDSSYDDSELESLISMSNSKFRDETEEYSPREIKSLKRDLINQKNSYMNDLRMLKKRKEKESSSASTSRERKEITSKFSPKISALGGRIDKIREKIAILND
jgi:hypothetical protein